MRWIFVILYYMAVFRCACIADVCIPRELCFLHNTLHFPFSILVCFLCIIVSKFHILIINVKNCSTCVQFVFYTRFTMYGMSRLCNIFREKSLQVTSKSSFIPFWLVQIYTYTNVTFTLCIAYAQEKFWVIYTVQYIFSVRIDCISVGPYSFTSLNCQMWPYWICGYLVYGCFVIKKKKKLFNMGMNKAAFNTNILYVLASCNLFTLLTLISDLIRHGFSFWKS
jgi:hypothetical protein